jgi:glutamine amidotransferase
MIAIVDYGCGNLYSLSSSLNFLGIDCKITGDINEIRSADKIILPGVGAFADAIAKLRGQGLDEFLISQAKKGKYIMGICLGMQMLFEKSYEYGCHSGLGLLKGNVVPIKGYVDESLKVPHIGWNGLHKERDNFLLKEVKEGDCAYFVHSYFVKDCEDSVTSTTEYGKPLTASVGKDNVLGCQFHPEKSGDVGLKILKAFWEKKD